MHVTRPNLLDLGIVCGYFAATLLIGYLTRRNSKNSIQYLNASRALPWWIAALSFLAVNSGGLEVVGIPAMTAEYGIGTLHFYLVGAIPAMIFLALFMIPVYMRSRALSVPEFLNLRFNMQTRLLNAISLLVISSLLAGISLYAMAQTLKSFVDWTFLSCTLIAGALALTFLVLGGLKATIYNELLQLTLIVAGLTPLAILILLEFHGVDGLLASLSASKAHLWTAMPNVSRSAPMDRAGVLLGLGFVLSFGYWCTDFRLMQRALTTRRAQDARLVPLVAGVGKLLFPLLVIVPGLAASQVLFLSAFGSNTPLNYDQALPLMIHHYYGHGLFGLGIVAILASLMSGLSGNVAAFSSLWTQEIYRPHLAPRKTEAHYIFVGRLAMLIGVVLSISTAFIALYFANLMDYIQFLFSLFNAPLLAVFLLGMFTAWVTPWGGFWGLLSGMVVGILHNAASREHWLTYGSQMGANFYGAIYAWAAATVMAVGVSLFTVRKQRNQLAGLVFELRIDEKGIAASPVWILALLLAAACVGLNVWLR